MVAPESFLSSQAIDGVGKLEDGTRVFFGIARSPSAPSLSER